MPNDEKSLPKINQNQTKEKNELKFWSDLMKAMKIL